MIKELFGGNNNIAMNPPKVMYLFVPVSEENENGE